MLFRQAPWGQGDGADWDGGMGLILPLTNSFVFVRHSNCFMADMSAEERLFRLKAAGRPLPMPLKGRRLFHQQQQHQHDPVKPLPILNAS